ncbi:hypothetical protein [Streptomyces axinellae]
MLVVGDELAHAADASQAVADIEERTYRHVPRGPVYARAAER